MRGLLRGTPPRGCENPNAWRNKSGEIKLKFVAQDTRERPLSSAKIEQSKGCRLLTGAFIFGATFLVAMIAMQRGVSVYDEGLILTGAMRVGEGAVPHRDFYANYGPAQFFTVAAIFKLFGASILVERTWDLVVKAGIACLIYVTASRLMGRLFAAAVTATCIVWLAFLGMTSSYPIWPSLFFILLGILPIFSLFDGRYSVAGLLAAGLCIGFVVLFRYDVGFLACAAESAVLSAFGLFGRIEGGTRLRRMAALLLPFWLGTAFVVVPLFVAYAATGVISDFIFQMLEFPSKNYARTRALPFPGFSSTGGVAGNVLDVIVYFPVLVVIASIAWLRSRAPRGDESVLPAEWDWKLVLLATLVFALFFKGVVRVGALQMALSIIPAFITFGALAEQIFLRRNQPSRRTTATLVIAALVVSASATLPVAPAFGRLH